jgi:hypothetical protein
MYKAFSDGEVRAHRLVLASCSKLLKQLLSDADDDDPLLLLPQVRTAVLSALLNFLYTVGRGPFLTSPLGANFDPRGEVVPQR